MSRQIWISFARISLFLKLNMYEKRGKWLEINKIIESTEARVVISELLAHRCFFLDIRSVICNSVTLWHILSVNFTNGHKQRGKMSSNISDVIFSGMLPWIVDSPQLAYDGYSSVLIRAENFILVRGQVPTWSIAIDRSSNSEPDLGWILLALWSRFVLVLKRMAERDLICVRQIRRQNCVTPAISSDRVEINILVFCLW